MPFKDRHLKIHDSVEYGAILAARHTPGNERGGERGRQGKNLKGDNRDTKKHPSFVFSPSNFLFIFWHKNMNLVKWFQVSFQGYWGNWWQMGTYRLLLKKKMKGFLSSPLLLEWENHGSWFLWLARQSFRGDSLLQDIGPLLLGSWQSRQAARERETSS